ncbi:MAG: signal peptidase II [Cloacibacillus sp.]
MAAGREEAFMVAHVAEWIKNKKLLSLFCFFCALVAADRITKLAAISFFARVSRNSGVSFGMLTGSEPRLLIFLNLAAAIFLLFMIFTMRRRPMPLLAGVAAMLAGAVGNLADRIIYCHVVDWMPLPFLNGQFFSGFFPSGLAVNLADLYLITGALVVFVALVKGVFSELK